jgi:UDP-N-acetylmuramoylalanine--D-glutamate ligase
MRLPQLTGKRVAVWGLGVEGRAAMALLPTLARPASLVAVTDADGSAADVLREADAVVKSPGISRHREDAEALAAAGVLTSGTNLFLAETGGRGVVGVTGSKGKSTTSALLAHLLVALGEKVELGGNIGRAPLELLAVEPRPGRFVVELSSFQCADAEDSPEVGVLTALFAEHLDWHGSLAAYIDDKCNLFAHRADAVTVVDGANALAASVSGRLPNPVPFGVPGGVHVDGGAVWAGRRRLFGLEASPLVGGHNGSNLCAALTVLSVLGHDPAAAEPALGSFRPLPHRLEVVGDVDGRLVVDDGLSTAPPAAIAALAAFPGRPVTILLGGHDRGLDYGQLATAVADRPDPTLVLTLPASGARLAAVIGGRADVVTTAGLEEAVAVALERTPAGGVILLSPAAPSFGEFRDYRERSAAFRRLLGLQ